MDLVGTSLLLIAVGVWVGAIIFQSAIVAPTVFVDLDEAAARVFLRRLFPRFFRLGLVCGALMLAGLALIGFDHRLTGLIAGVTAVMLLLEGLSLWLVPKINAARDAGLEARFQAMHRLSVLMTVAILLLGLGILTLVGAARPFGH